MSWEMGDFTKTYPTESSYPTEPLSECKSCLTYNYIIFYG